MKRIRWFFRWFLFGYVLCVAACATPAAVSQRDPAAEVKPFYTAVEELSHGLIVSSAQHQVGRIAVTDFYGPEDSISALGEHIADKVSLHLFAGNAFPDYLERHRLRELLASHKEEMSGYFDQDTVSRFGHLVGVESVVIGRIEDLGPWVDVTATIVESATGRRQGMAEVRIFKDPMVAALLEHKRRATLTVFVEPAATGSVTAGDVTADLVNGMARFFNTPYGPCTLIIRAQGFQHIGDNRMVRSQRETWSYALTPEQHTVSFQIAPPEAALVVDGASIPVDYQGKATMDNLAAREYTYAVRAAGYRESSGTFNPAREQLIRLALERAAPDHPIHPVVSLPPKAAIRTVPDIELWTDKQSYRLGERIVIYCRAQRDCYLSLVTVNSRGEPTVLFPNAYHPDNAIQGKTLYSIPGEWCPFVYTATRPTGTDTIYAVAGLAPLTLIADSGGIRGIAVQGKETLRDAAAVHSIEVYQ